MLGPTIPCVPAGDARTSVFAEDVCTSVFAGDARTSVFVGDARTSVFAGDARTSVFAKIEFPKSPVRVQDLFVLTHPDLRKNIIFEEIGFQIADQT